MSVMRDLGHEKHSQHVLIKGVTPIISVSNEENYINTGGRYVSLQLF